MYEWNEEKRNAVLLKHSIDFFDVVEIFAQDHLILHARSDVEERRIAVGQMNSVTLAVVYTHRDGAIRIITARRARKNEREQFEALLARRSAGDEG